MTVYYKLRVCQGLKPSVTDGDHLGTLHQRETVQIFKLNATVYPGLNEETDFRPFLWNICLICFCIVCLLFESITMFILFDFLFGVSVVWFVKFWGSNP